MATCRSAAACSLAASAAVLWELWAGRQIVGGDTLTYFFPQKAYLAHHLARGVLPLWNNLTGHGYPFVADSQIERMEANVESLDNLKVNLREQGYALDKVPYVVQYNKRDLPNAAPLEELQRLLNPLAAPEYESCATTGEGVFETLKATAKGVLADLKKMGA